MGSPWELIVPFESRSFSRRGLVCEKAKKKKKKKKKKVHVTFNNV